eukprot:scaffold149590_cov35-Attheya_sp.AAC.1
MTSLSILWITTAAAMTHPESTAMIKESEPDAHKFLGSKGGRNGKYYENSDTCKLGKAKTGKSGDYRT